MGNRFLAGVFIILISWLFLPKYYEYSQYSVYFRLSKAYPLIVDLDELENPAKFLHLGVSAWTKPIRWSKLRILVGLRLRRANKTTKALIFCKKKTKIDKT